MWSGCSRSNGLSIFSKRGTRRWPVAVIYNILDLACMNAFVLYKEKTGDSISRRDFIFKLVTELREDYLAQKKIQKCI